MTIFSNKVCMQFIQTLFVTQQPLLKRSNLVKESHVCLVFQEDNIARDAKLDFLFILNDPPTMP